MRCVIFRCSNKQEMYLYVPYQPEEAALLQHLPASLRNLTGRLDKVMELELSPGRKLARAQVEEVLAALQQQGFYLQMPVHELLRKDDRMLHDPADGF